MHSFCLASMELTPRPSLLASMELTPRPNCSLLYLHSNDMKSLFFENKVIPINIIVIKATISLVV